MDDRTPGYDEPEHWRDELLMRPITEEEFGYIVAASWSRTEAAFFDPQPDDGRRWA